MLMKMEMLIAVDEEDNATGTIEKMEAHQQGKLHRAFSVLFLARKANGFCRKGR
jgi:isopentenyl-diphosphate delta-isomerase